MHKVGDTLGLVDDTEPLVTLAKKGVMAPLHLQLQNCHTRQMVVESTGKDCSSHFGGCMHGLLVLALQALATHRREE